MKSVVVTYGITVATMNTSGWFCPPAPNPWPHQRLYLVIGFTLGFLCAAIIVASIYEQQRSK